MNAIRPSSPDERELMRSLHEGSIAALGALYRRTAPYLYPLALRIAGSRERACAVIEDLFEEIWRDRARWRGALAIPTVDWIARCRELALAQAVPDPGRADLGRADLGRADLGRTDLDRPDSRRSDSRRADPNRPGPHRSDRRRPMTDPIAAAPVLTPAPSPAAAAEAARFDPHLGAREALASLPETDRRALEEAYFHGANAREVAVLIGAPTSDAAMTLRSALVRFREHFAEHGQDGEREAAAAAAGSAS